MVPHARNLLEGKRRSDRNIEGVVVPLSVRETITGIVEPGIAELAVQHDTGAQCILGCGDHAVEVAATAGSAVKAPPPST